MVLDMAKYELRIALVVRRESLGVIVGGRHVTAGLRPKVTFWWNTVHVGVPHAKVLVFVGPEVVLVKLLLQ